MTLSAYLPLLPEIMILTSFEPIIDEGNRVSMKKAKKILINLIGKVVNGLIYAMNLNK